MKNEIQIVDRGRGLQLSTSRITVQDLVPYFQDGCAHEVILRWIPTLTLEEIAVVDAYYREHKPELDADDLRIRERGANRKNPSEIGDICRGGEKMAALRAEFEEKKRAEELNRDRVAG